MPQTQTNPTVCAKKKRLGQQAAVRLRRGTLTLRQLLQLNDAEIDAIARVAEHCRRRGRLSEASSIYGLLIAHDPLNAVNWRALAGVKRRLGDHAAAVACYEMLAVIEGRDATCTYHEAHCLRQLNQPRLARDLARIALSLAGTSNPPWAEDVRRWLGHHPGGVK